MVPVFLVWDNDLITYVFNTMDIKTITSIPFSLHIIADRWYWLPNSKGNHIAHSSYRALQKNLVESGPGFWNVLWHMEIPPEVKNFVWRMMHTAVRDDTSSSQLVNATLL